MAPKGQENYFSFEVQFHLDIRPYFHGAELPGLMLTSVAAVCAQAGNMFLPPQNFETSQFFLISLLQITDLNKAPHRSISKKDPK